MLPRPVFASCPECGAGYGETHWPKCAVRESRGTPTLTQGFAKGQAHAIRECRRRGWAVIDVPGQSLRPCRPDEPGSYVDLDRYAYWLEHGDRALNGNEPVDAPQDR